MELQDLLDAMNAGERIEGGSPLHEVMHRISQDALRITGELNGGYHDQAQVRDLLAQLTGTTIADSVTVFPPLTSDFGVPAEWTTIVVGLMILVFVVLQRVVSAVGKKE